MQVSYNGLPAKALDGDDHHGPGHRPLQPVQSMSDAYESKFDHCGCTHQEPENMHAHCHGRYLCFGAGIPGRLHARDVTCVALFAGTSNLSGRQSVAGAPKVLGQEWTLDDVRMKRE